MSIRHIVAATDFSPAAEVAARCAARLASRLDAILSLVSVASGPDAESETDLAALGAELEAPEQTAIQLLDGSGPKSLADWLRTSDADLVFCGAHGSGSISEALFGSFANRLVLLSPCPVWIARQPTLPSSLLLSTDLQGVSKNAQDLAIGLCAGLECDLHVVHVLHRPSFRFGHGGDLEQHYAGAASEASEEIERSIGSRTKPASCKVLSGDPAGEILAAAVENQLIVCGTHGRSGLERWLVGSVAEKLVKRSPTSVLVVPPAAEDLALRGEVPSVRTTCTDIRQRRGVGGR